MEFKVKADLLNQVIAYLATKPFQEVANLIDSIRQGAELIGEIAHEEKTVSGNDQEG